GVDLRLKGAKDVALAGELAPEIGEAEIGGGGDVGEADFAPALILGEVERRPHGFGTLGKIVEHGGTPSLGKISAFRGRRKATGSSKRAARVVISRAWSTCSQERTVTSASSMSALCQEVDIPFDT